jgi:hypothetical protein
LKAFEAIFFLSFLALYYAVLVPIQRNGRDRPARPGQPPLTANGTAISFESDRQHSFHSITVPEVLLFLWVAGFAYDECKSGYRKHRAHWLITQSANIVMPGRHFTPLISGACKHGSQNKLEKIY